MADKTIGDLPVASELYDDSLLVVEQQREARSIKGELIAKFAKEEVQEYVQGAVDAAEIAKGSAGAAKASETAAALSEQNAAASADQAGAYNTEAKSYAVGGTGSREGEDVDNAAYYYDQAKRISQGLSGTLLPMGTIPFTELSTTSKDPGYMYNISDAFTTDATFKEGAGHAYPAGTNVYYTADGYWDCLAGAQVVSVNGQTGAVTVTKDDIGLGNVPNVSTNDQMPTFTQAGSRSNIASGDKLSTLFGKIAKWFVDLKAVAFSGNYSDLTGTPGAASQSAAGLMSAADKKKLDGIAAGAQVNAVTSVNKKTGAVTLTSADIGAVAKAGDTMTGDLTLSGEARAVKYASGSRTGTPIAFYAGDGNGSGVVIGDGGRTIIGGGESAQNLRGALTTTDSSEEMHMASDGAVYIHTNCNTIANRKTITVDTAGKITTPGGFATNSNNTLSLGSDGNYPLFARFTNSTYAFDFGVNSSGVPFVHKTKGFDPTEFLYLPSTTGKNASGTWSINVTGNAASATKVGHKLTFTGGVTGDWDGSAAKSVKIPGALGDLSNGVWSAGNSIDYDSILLNGYITNSGKNVVLLFSLGRLIKGGVTAKVTKLNGVLRGVSGYVGGSSAFDLFGGATVSVVQHADIGQVQITVSKSAAFIDAVNNTPVAFVGAVTVSFAASSDEPMPGPEIFGDETAGEGPSMEDGAGTPEKEVETV